MVHYELNDELNGIELYFDGIFPNENLRNKMKKAGLRWNPRKKCWYTKQWNQEGVTFIKKYCSEIEFTEKLSNAKVLSFDSIMTKRCCYADLISNFSNEKQEEFIQKIKSAFLKEHVLKLNQLQINAWVDSFKVMQNINLNHYFIKQIRIKMDLYHIQN